MCRVCRCRVDAADGFCRTCGAPDPLEPKGRATPPPTRRSGQNAAASVDPGAFRVPGGMLALAGLLVGVGCGMPWITAMGMFGLTPPMEEIWPIIAGAGVLGILGLTALAYDRQISRSAWLLSLLAAVGIAVLTYPHYQEVAQEVIASGSDAGVSQGTGLWLVAAGIVTALIASAAGWGAGAKSGSR